MEFDLGGFVAVSEQIAARRLGVSLDMIRRDRRTGRLGIPFIKINEGKRGLVRYDLADIERYIEARKRIGGGVRPAPRPRAPGPSARDPAPGVELTVQHPPDPAPRSAPLTKAAALEHVRAWEKQQAWKEPEVDPFAAAGRSAPRRQGSGYWGH